MNCDNGHIVTQEMFDLMSEVEQRKYKAIPAELTEEAQKALNGKKETTIDLKAPGPLQNFAAMNRKQRRNVQRMMRKQR